MGRNNTLGPLITRSGDVISSSMAEHISSAPINANAELRRNMAIAEGQVTKVYTIDAAGNTVGGTPLYTLYDVRIVRTHGGSEIVYACRMLQPSFGGGISNFFEVVQTDPGPKADKATIPDSLKRGHRVLIGFIEGDKSSGVILGTLPHKNPAAVARRPKADKGVHMEGEVQGLNFVVKNDGSFQLVFNGPRDDEGALVGQNGPTQIEITKDGNINVTTNQMQTITVDRLTKHIKITNGSTFIDMDQDGDKIQVVATNTEIGTGDLQPHVVGNDWKSIMEELILEIENIVVPTGVGPSGMPINKAKFEAIKAKLKNALSRNHKVEK